jgi:hypothetical protein
MNSRLRLMTRTGALLAVFAAEPVDSATLWRAQRA